MLTVYVMLITFPRSAGWARRCRQDRYRIARKCIYTHLLGSLDASVSTRRMCSLHYIRKHMLMKERVELKRLSLKADAEAHFTR